MNRILYMLLLPLLLTACLPVAGKAQQKGQRVSTQRITDVEAAPEADGIRFTLSYLSEAYTVWMEPTVTPADPNLTLSIQVTLKVPHGVGNNRFELDTLQSSVQNVLWAQLSRVDAPKEDPNADYISLEAGYIGGDRGAFGWQAGTPIKAFTFQNNGPCLGTISLVSNADPFVPAVGESNSASTNPGNYIRVVGLGDGNAFVESRAGEISANCDLRSDVRIDSAMVRRLAQMTDDGNNPMEILWSTIHETDLIGFNVLRRIGNGEAQPINNVPIVAHQSGQANGAAYQLIDEGLSVESTVAYLLELLLIDGESIQYSFGPIMTNFTHLPMIAR